MDNKLWRFTDNFGSFESKASHKIKTLYFPLANEVLMSSITPGLQGDIKTGQNSFLLTPVSRINLVDSKSSRNFWIYIDPVRNSDSGKSSNISNGVNRDKIWSATGNSKDLKQIKEDRFNLQAGLLWHKITRENKKIGLKAEILSFVPATGFGKRKPNHGLAASGEPVEIMQVKITNITSQRIKFIPTSAIPIYARSANNLRDHRHVTSLLNRIMLHKFGVIVRPTLLFDESGHKPNKNHYFVLGWDEKFNPPQYIYPAQEMFCGEDGDLEAPNSIINNILPTEEQIQGKEAMGALRFPKITLRPRESHSYIILMGITEDWLKIKSVINKFSSLDKVKIALQRTKDFWISLSRQINLSTGNSDFDNWFHWVSIQPNLRRIFGCSFLPDFDYGKGGRGWRDLWQDCLGLILSEPKRVCALLINNFSGVRIDGSNATIIGKKPGEFTPLETRRQRRQTVASGNLSLTGFKSDRNNISRVWMDHGVWPLLTLDLYLNETGDFDILFKETTYFRDHQILRARAIDYNWNPSYGQRLKTTSGRIYKGTVLEHLLVQTLVQFFNVGSHNHIRLEGADWNDGLDMAKENGEGVAFSCMYAFNLKLLAEWLLRVNKKSIKIAKEIKILLKKINYNDVKAKQKVLDEYFAKTKFAVSGGKISIDTALLADDLKKKSEWMMEHIRKKEWLKQGFFNGYYDNQKKRVEGRNNNITKMILISQVFPIMSGVAGGQQIKSILKNVQKYLFDKRLKGYHLNTDFKEEQYNLGRAFSFVYGDKENGSFFNHMIVLFAYALYKRGFVKQGWDILKSICNMAMNTERSKIYPCLPEYFNLEGRGMYPYLTGSASWFVLTMIDEVFGIKGKEGNLVIEPKFFSGQFKGENVAVRRVFAERKLEVRFYFSRKISTTGLKILKAELNSKPLFLKSPAYIEIERKTLFALPKNKINRLFLEIAEKIPK